MTNIFFIAAAIYAIIGGPSVGKTSIIEELKADGEATIEETATALIKESIDQGINEPWLKENFQPTIFMRQLALEKEALKKDHNRIFVDRGLLDNLVYLELNNKRDSKEYKSIEDQLKTIDIAKRYAAIFFIEPHTKESFQLEQNPIRRESTDEALVLAEKIKAAYAKHYKVITIPGGLSPKRRASLIKEKIKSLT